MNAPAKPTTTQLAKKGAGHFLLGRTVSGLASVVVNIYLIRVLSLTEYAAYVSLTALQLFGLAAFSLGLDRIVAVLAGRGRSSWSVDDLVWLVKRAVGARLMIVGLALGFIEVYLAYFDSHGLEFEIRIAFYAQCLFFAAFEVLLAASQALLLQRRIRDALFVQWVARLAIMLVIGFIARLDLLAAMWIIAGTTFASCLILTLGVVTFLSRARIDADRLAANRPALVREMVATGLNNQIERWLQSPSSGGALRLASAAIASAGYVSMFGFLQSLVAAVQRYTPLTLGGQMITGVLAGAEDDQRGAGERVCTIFAKTTIVMLSFGIAISLAGGDDIVRWMTAGKLQEGATMLAILLAGLGWASAWQAIVVVENVGADRSVLAKCSLVGATVAGVCIVIAFGFDAVSFWLLPLIALLAYACQLVVYAAKRQWAWLMSTALIKFSAMSVFCGMIPRLVEQFTSPIPGGVISDIFVACLLFVLCLKLLGVFSNDEISALAGFDRRMGRWASILSYRG